MAGAGGWGLNLGSLPSIAHSNTLYVLTKLQVSIYRGIFWLYSPVGVFDTRVKEGRLDIEQLLMQGPLILGLIGWPELAGSRAGESLLPDHDTPGSHQADLRDGARGSAPRLF